MTTLAYDSIVWNTTGKITSPPSSHLLHILRLAWSELQLGKLGVVTHSSPTHILSYTCSALISVITKPCLTFVNSPFIVKRRSAFPG